MFESFLFEGFPVDVHATRPVTKQRTKTANEIRPLRCAIVTLADVIAQVVEQEVVRVGHKFPIALTHGLLRTVRTGG